MSVVEAVAAAQEATEDPKTPDSAPGDAPAEAAPAVESADPLDTELEATRKAVEAEKAAKPADPVTTEAAPVVEPPQAAKPVVAQPQGDLRAALRAERTRRQNAELELARTQGALEVFNKVADIPAADQPQEQQDPLTQLDEQRLALAQKLDEGEMTMAEYRQQDRALERQADQIKDEQRQQQADEQQREATLSDSTLEQHDKDLMAKYPIMTQLNADQAKVLEDMAYQQAALTGKPIGTGVAGTKELHTRMAIMAAQTFGVEPVQQQPPATGAAAPTPLSRQAQQTAAALDKAETAPPDVSKLGTTSTAALPSDADVEARLKSMSDEEALKYLETMPGLRKRLLGA